MGRSFYRALHIKRLAVLVEQFPRKWAGRRLGRAFAMRGGLIAQASLDLLPQLAAQYRLVLPWMAFLLVADFAEVDRVRQHLVKSPARKLSASRSHAIFRLANFGDDLAALQIGFQEPDGTEFEISLIDVFHRRGFGPIDHQPALADVIAERNRAVHPHSL